LTCQLRRGEFSTDASNQPFEHADQLARLQRRQAELNEALTPAQPGQTHSATETPVAEPTPADSIRHRLEKRTAPPEFSLPTRTIASDDTTATVEVSSMMVIAAADERVARQAWRTVTLE
jgi:hypothetical protein